MGSVSSHRTGTARALSAVIVRVAALGGALGCAQMLGIPADPELAPSPSSLAAPTVNTGHEALPAPNAAPAPSGAGPNAMPEGVSSELATPPVDGVAADGIVPAENVAGIDETLAPDVASATPVPARGPDAGVVDAGSDAQSEEPAVPACEGQFDRVPVDVVFLVDNSGSMPAVDAAFEAALPEFVARLEQDGVDHRVVLLSRHRQAARSASEEASTSVCVAAPVSGLAACPSERPAEGPRFFPYSIKLDATNSFERALTAFSTPDPFGLAPSGWSEWLRVGARKVFIELTDSDSALPGAEFVHALAVAAPEHFKPDVNDPGFVFHSILGLAQKTLALDLYGPDEPIELDVCSGTGTNPDNAGSVYQELSRTTGGLRQSICPVAVLDLRLEVLAADVVRRSVLDCVVGG